MNMTKRDHVHNTCPLLKNEFFWYTYTPHLKYLLNMGLCLKKQYPLDTNEIEAILKKTIPFVPPVTQGIVVKVYDGDTFTIASKLPYKSSPLYRLSVRINGIDCPEMKSKYAEEKDHAKLAQQCTSMLILGKHVHLSNISTDKYGRLLADVVVGKINVGEYLLKQRFAVEYDGGTKKIMNWKKYFESN